LTLFFSCSFRRSFTHTRHTLDAYFFFNAIYVRIRESKYRIRYFFFVLNIVGNLFQNINFDNNIEEMATGSSYKHEIHPFETESKF
jgi:hypothetical protein